MYKVLGDRQITEVDGLHHCLSAKGLRGQRQATSVDSRSR